MSASFVVLGQARWLSCLICFGIRLGIEEFFIPQGRPQHNGPIENFNGRFSTVDAQSAIKWPVSCAA